MLANQSISLCATLLSLAVLPPPDVRNLSNDPVRMNQIQVIGTHISYHAGIASSEAKLMMTTNP